MPKIFDAGTLKVTFRVGDYDYAWTNSELLVFSSGLSYEIPVSASTAPIGPNVNGHEYVTMCSSNADGKKILFRWATCNLGAENPWDSGNHYAWGETDVKTEYTWKTYKWCKESESKLTRYCPTNRTDIWGGSGNPDGKSDFKDYNYADDAARKALGGKWRVPTTEDWSELIDYCSIKWERVNGMGGIRITGKNENSIFLPASGCMTEVGLLGSSSNGHSGNGYYWRSSLNPENPQGALYIRITPMDELIMDMTFRNHGHNIRPVTD